MDFKVRIVREYDRLKMLEEQIYTLRKERQARLENAEDPSMRKVVQLMTLHSIGVQSYWKFVQEFFGWREL